MCKKVVKLNDFKHLFLMAGCPSIHLEVVVNDAIPGIQITGC